MTYQPVDLLKVSIWGDLVGAVAASPSGRGYVFEYDPTWVRRGIELAPALMPTTRRNRIYTFPDLPDTFRSLPPMLADSVPDDFGNAIINAALAREGVQAEHVTPLDRLAYVGDRGMGALTYEPDTGPSTQPATPVILAELVTAARAAVEGTLDDDTHRTAALHQLLAVGTSAGGARAKAVLAWNRETNQMQAGNLPAPPGYEQWLLKFDGAGNDPELGHSGPFGRIEYAYSLMARAAGIDMAPTMLLEEGGRAHFMTRRFDRGPDGERLHMQTLCAMDALDFNQPRVHDYASYLMRCDQLGLDEAARQEAYRRIAFNVLASNCDDHTKNFSFLMNPNGQWRLAPAYDLTYSYRPDSPWVAQHQMSIEGKFDAITRTDLALLADRFAIPEASAILNRVHTAVSSWPDFAHEAQVPPTARVEIAARLAAVHDQYAASA